MTGRPPRAIVCLPTYQERENVEQMIRALGDVLDPGQDRVLVIDDASPDGTGEIAQRIASELPWVSVLRRPSKEGLGRAYVAAFRHALAEGATLVLAMDCDFSHDPRDVPRLIAAAADADLVIGSRYVHGGETEITSPFRRLLSRGGCLYAQAFLGRRVRDLTGGFKCFRSEALVAIGLERVYTNGYGFQIEVTYRVVRAGLRVREIPIRFVERRAGISKLTGSIVAEAALKVPTLRGRALLGRL